MHPNGMECYGGARSAPKPPTAPYTSVGKLGTSNSASFPRTSVRKHRPGEFQFSASVEGPGRNVQSGSTEIRFSRATGGGLYRRTTDAPLRGPQLLRLQAPTRTPRGTGAAMNRFNREAMVVTSSSSNSSPTDVMGAECVMRWPHLTSSRGADAGAGAVPTARRQSGSLTAGQASSPNRAGAGDFTETKLLCSLSIESVSTNVMHEAHRSKRYQQAAMKAKYPPLTEDDVQRLRLSYTEYITNVNLKRMSCLNHLMMLVDSETTHPSRRVARLERALSLPIKDLFGAEWAQLQRPTVADIVRSHRHGRALTLDEVLRYAAHVAGKASGRKAMTAQTPRSVVVVGSPRARAAARPPPRQPAPPMAQPSALDISTPRKRGVPVNAVACPLDLGALLLSSSGTESEENAEEATNLVICQAFRELVLGSNHSTPDSMISNNSNNNNNNHVASSSVQFVRVEQFVRNLLDFFVVVDLRRALGTAVGIHRRDHLDLGEFEWIIRSGLAEEPDPNEPRIDFFTFSPQQGSAPDVMDAATEDHKVELHTTAQSSSSSDVSELLSHRSPSTGRGPPSALSVLCCAIRRWARRHGKKTSARTAYRISRLCCDPSSATVAPPTLSIPLLAGNNPPTTTVIVPNSAAPSAPNPSSTSNHSWRSASGVRGGLMHNNSGSISLSTGEDSSPPQPPIPRPPSVRSVSVESDTTINSSAKLPDSADHGAEPPSCAAVEVNQRRAELEQKLRHLYAEKAELIQHMSAPGNHSPNFDRPEEMAEEQRQLIDTQDVLQTVVDKIAMYLQSLAELREGSPIHFLGSTSAHLEPLATAVYVSEMPEDVASGVRTPLAPLGEMSTASEEKLLRSPAHSDTTARHCPSPLSLAEPALSSTHEDGVPALGDVVAATPSGTSVSSSHKQVMWGETNSKGSSTNLYHIPDVKSESSRASRVSAPLSRESSTVLIPNVEFGSALMNRDHAHAPNDPRATRGGAVSDTDGLLPCPRLSHSSSTPCSSRSHGLLQHSRSLGSSEYSSPKHKSPREKKSSRVGSPLWHRASTGEHSHRSASESSTAPRRQHEEMAVAAADAPSALADAFLERIIRAQQSYARSTSSPTAARHVRSRSQHQHQPRPSFDGILAHDNRGTSNNPVIQILDTEGGGGAAVAAACGGSNLVSSGGSHQPSTNNMDHPNVSILTHRVPSGGSHAMYAHGMSQSHHGASPATPSSTNNYNGSVLGGWRSTGGMSWSDTGTSAMMQPPLDCLLASTDRAPDFRREELSLTSMANFSKLHRSSGTHLRSTTNHNFSTTHNGDSGSALNPMFGGPKDRAQEADISRIVGAASMTEGGWSCLFDASVEAPPPDAAGTMVRRRSRP